MYSFRKDHKGISYQGDYVVVKSVKRVDASIIGYKPEGAVHLAFLKSFKTVKEAEDWLNEFNPVVETCLNPRIVFGKHGL